MIERPEESAREDLDAVRETTGDDDAAGAKEEYEDDPARNPDDDEVEGLKGG